MLYISDINLGFLGWKPELGDQSLPELTWASLKKVPPVILGMGALMGGVYWTINRRMRLAMQESYEGLEDAPAASATIAESEENEEDDA